MSALVPVLPDLDIWLKALSRRDPDLLVVHGFKRAVEARRVFLLGLVRQALLARVRDERQFARLAHALSAFPDLPVLARDHVRAAAIIRGLRGRVAAVTPWQALLWAVAERLPALVWSEARSWSPLAAQACPVSAAVPR
jgi:hypothetical protein